MIQEMRLLEEIVDWHPTPSINGVVSMIANIKAEPQLIQQIRLAQKKDPQLITNIEEEGDRVFLKISPIKGIMRFGKKGKLSPRYIGPFEILERIGGVAYRLALPPELANVHNVFHVSSLRKYQPDPSHILKYEPLPIRKDISFIEQPILILNRRVQKPLISLRIPREIAETSNLQQLAILDLSENNFEGSIPSCFHKSSAWVNGSRSTIRASTDAHVGLESEYVEVVNFYKRNEYGYSGIVLSVVTGIDLSLNHLSGPIPMEIGILKGLIVLNISNNHLNGTIPDSFAKLSQIEVLDLSHNMLKGRIPSDLGSLTFLSQFSVAYNDLEGAVPIVNNFQTFEESSYCGNPKLCGYLGKQCSENPKLCGYPRKKWVGDKPVLYACIAMEFVVGFWGVLWFLFLIKKWRFVWFKAMDGPIHRVFSGRE
ncbi:hypothetical protein AMTRI_Chr04g182510 [Amborella trichopoda]